MTRSRTIALAIGLFTLPALVGSTALAAVPPGSEPPGTGTAAALPPGFVPLIDDTSTITIAVPQEWTDVVTAPEVVDGVQMPRIEASTNRNTYIQTFDVAGVTFRAYPFTADTATLVSEHGLTGGCSSEATIPYDDGVFVGHRLIYTDCSTVGSPIEFHVIAANPQSQAFTALVQIQITTEAELAVLDVLLKSFNAAGGSAPPTAPAVPVVPATAVSSPSTAPVVPTVPVVPTTTGSVTPTIAPVATTSLGAAAFPPPSGSVPADWVQLVDSTQTITIAVPSAWTSTHTAPRPNSSGQVMPFIAATTDLDAYGAGYLVPGAEFGVRNYVADTAELAAIPYEECTSGGLQTYDDGRFVGHIQTWTNCGGTATTLMVLVANTPPDTTHTVVVTIQLTGQPDDALTLDGLLSSFSFVSNPSPTAATTTPGLPTTTA
jgi:hypothetical protein